MVKRREVKKYAQVDIEQEIEKFAAGADGEPVKQLELNRNARRDYKAMQVPFNQWEFERLEEACKIAGRTKLGFVRYSMLKLAEEIINKN
ncbi:MAG: hypothetical protein WC856_13720 [Methylococcaceae bacterium]|jgi:hypothetical protein